MQCIVLRRIGLVVEIGGNPPLGLHHGTRRRDGERDIEPVEGDVAEFSFVDVPGDQGGAMPSVGGLVKTQGHAASQLQVSK